MDLESKILKLLSSVASIEKMKEFEKIEITKTRQSWNNNLHEWFNLFIEMNSVILIMWNIKVISYVSNKINGNSLIEKEDVISKNDNFSQMMVIMNMVMIIMLMKKMIIIMLMEVMKIIKSMLMKKTIKMIVLVKTMLVMKMIVVEMIKVMLMIVMQNMIKII